MVAALFDASRANATFLHYEALGPRAELDRWLGTLQDAGVCHLADALRELEGEAGIGRPELRAEELHANLLQSEAARALRGVSRVLPPTPRVPGGERRPDWTLGPGGMGERDVIRLKDEARNIATALHAVLGAVRVAEAQVAGLDAADAALAALEAANESAAGTYVFRLPLETLRMRRLKRGLTKLGAKTLLARAPQNQVLVVLPSTPGSPAGSHAVLSLGASLGADGASLPSEVAGLAPTDARTRLGEQLRTARQSEREARLALQAKVGEVGIRGRFLLDSLSDAEERTVARRQLASTEHVTAARLYVRPEDEPRLRERVRAAHGDVVVLRPLAEADDAPTLPRRIAEAPFAALRGLVPERFGDVAPSSVLALLAPIAAGIVWGDLVGGLLLLLSGGLLGWRAGPGSPRRDTALLAQVAGFAAMLVGVLTGRAFGSAGEVWFGSGWGVAPALDRWLPGGFAGVFLVLGAGAMLLAAWGSVLALRAWGRRRSARARSLIQTSLVYLTVAGLAAAVAGPTSPLFPAAWLAAGAALALWLLGGARHVLLRLGLELVGVLRLVAVAGAALLVCQAVFGSWIELSVLDLTVGVLALLVASLAMVADPAHVAMGVPYDLALGGRRLSRPFAPFRRHARDGQPSSSSAHTGRGGAA